MSAKFRALRWVNVTELGSVSGASYVIADHYIFPILFAVALHEKPGSLRSSRFLSLRHFLWPPVSPVQGLVPAFTLLLSSHDVAIMDER